MRAVIKGKRVTLRRPQMKDADVITEYCQDKALHKYTIRIPWPYKRKDAVWWVKDAAERWKTKTGYCYVIMRQGVVVGVIDLRPEKGDKASFGYWIGQPYWGQGFATEATKLLIKEGFKTLKLNKIFATHNPKNPASGKVMEKVGMKYEGLLRDHEKKGKKYVDEVYRSILRREYRHRNS